MTNPKGGTQSQHVSYSYEDSLGLMISRTCMPRTPNFLMLLCDMKTAAIEN